jgi:hypothetical protein
VPKSRGHMAPLELPYAGRWVPELRGHVAPLELPYAGRWVPELRGHVAPLELHHPLFHALPCMVSAWWCLSRPHIIHIG